MRTQFTFAPSNPKPGLACHQGMPLPYGWHALLYIGKSWESLGPVGSLVLVNC